MSKSLSEKIADIIIGVKNKKVNEMTNKEYDTVILREKASRVEKYEEKIKNKIRELNLRQKKEVLENLSEATKSAKAVDPKKLFSLKGWINIFIDAITPIAKDLFVTEANHALTLIDKPGLDIANTPAAKQAIDRAMKLMSESYNQTTVDALESKLNEGISQGFSVPKLSALVSDIYDWSDTARADRVALTESNRIMNTAGKIAWKESGVVAKIMWITSERDNVCGYCQDLDGKEIGIDDNFYDKGDDMTSADGQTMTNDYSDMGGPPAHPNCHCGIKPIVDTSKSGDSIVDLLEEAAMSELNKLDDGKS